MKKLSFLLIVLSLSIIFGACPPLEEDDLDSFYTGNVITFDEPFELDVYKWFEILDGVARERKYVSLDLSKGTYVNGNEGGGLIIAKVKHSVLDTDVEYLAFDPFPAASSGKNYILSIILPTAAQMINQAVEDTEIDDDADEETVKETKKRSAFRSFSRLRSIKADNVTLIGNFAFADCTELKEVIFPRVGHLVSTAELGDADNQMSNGFRTDIGRYAFQGCTELKEVKFNSAAIIGKYAFKGCTNLSKIDFPEVWNIEKNAFQGCKSLVNVFFEKASKIGEEAFKDCAKLKKAEFNVEPTQVTLTDPLAVSPCVYDSVIFYPSVFNGCKVLDTLNVRRAWNVYLSKDVLANTGSAVNIYLFDEPSGGDSFGHPQNAKFLGEGATATLKTVNILIPTNGEKILGNFVPENIARFIRTSYTNVDVNINGRAL
jgi:hypothetical protein